MRDNSFTPKLLTLIRAGMTRQQLFKDMMAGLVVGIVALPLAIAFAIASGVPPDKGLITAVIAGLCVSVLGGSRVQIGGPTGAFIVIVYSIVQTHGLEGLAIATFMAGFIIIGMGVARLGSLLKFIPYPLVVGFTSGIAVVIFSSQIRDLFGLPVDEIPADFLDKWKVYALHYGKVDWVATAIAAGTVLIIIVFHRITSKFPGSIIAILLSTILVQWFELPVDTIETRFGEIRARIALPSIPQVNFETIRALLQPAFAIALLGSIESLLSAVVSDGMIGGRHRSNAELVAQGTANVLTGIFGGMPATGAIARTATNIKSGGRTPVAGIVHALVILLIMLLFAPYAKLIPMACLAGVLVVVAYHMSEWRNFVSLLNGNRMDILVLLVTFFLTVIFDLVIAIEVGVVLASLLFMKRMSEAVDVRGAVDTQEEGATEQQLFEEELPKLPRGVVLYEINGALFFGAAQKFQEIVDDLHVLPKVLILRMRNVPFIDATGIHRLKDIIRHFDRHRVQVILSGVSQQVQTDLEQAGVYELLSRENVLRNIQASVERAKAISQPER